VEKQNKSQTKQLELFEEWLQVRDPESSHYPSIFGLTSMFLPVKDRKKGDTSGWGSTAGVLYKAGDFTILRIGPGLSTYDEDTLIAILQLSQERQIIGSEEDVRENLLPNLLQSKSDAGFLASSTNFYFVGTITPYKINKYFGRETSGSGLADCNESMVRLSQIKLTITKKGSSKIADTHFFSLIRDEDVNKPITVVIDPIMASLLQDFVVVDLTLRRKLTPIGKSVYRYLQASGVKAIPVVDLMEKIGTSLAIADFNRALLGRKPTKNSPGTQGELNVLQEAGWLKAYSISGTGRNTPFILNVTR
jgi:hypothetical protein